VLYLCVLPVELVAGKWNGSVDLWTKTQVSGEGGPIPVTLWPPQIPHGLDADFKCYHEGQMIFPDVAVMYTNLRSKIDWMCGFQVRRQTYEKRLLTSSCVCLSVRPSAWSNSAPSGQTFGIWVLFGDLSRKFKFL